MLVTPEMNRNEPETTTRFCCTHQRSSRSAGRGFFVHSGMKIHKDATFALVGAGLDDNMNGGDVPVQYSDVMQSAVA